MCDFPNDRMTDDEMVSCYADADVCVFAENYEAVSLPPALAQQKKHTHTKKKKNLWGFRAKYWRHVGEKTGKMRIKTDDNSIGHCCSTGGA